MTAQEQTPQTQNPPSAGERASNQPNQLYGLTWATLGNAGVCLGSLHDTPPRLLGFIERDSRQEGAWNAWACEGDHFTTVAIGVSYDEARSSIEASAALRDVFRQMCERHDAAAKLRAQRDHARALAKYFYDGFQESDKPAPLSPLDDDGWDV